MNFKFAITFVFFFLCSGMLLQAQELKTMTGIVRDASGFVLPGVIISVQQTNHYDELRGSSILNFMSIREILAFSTDPALGVYIDGVPMFADMDYPCNYKT